MQVLFLVWLIYEFAYICIFVLGVVHHFKQHNSWGRTKIERKAGRKTRVQVFNASCVTFFLHLKPMQLVNISVQKSLLKVFRSTMLSVFTSI